MNDFAMSFVCSKSIGDKVREYHTRPTSEGFVPPEGTSPRIVCAANRTTDGTVVPGPRHYDPVMRALMNKMGLSQKECLAMEQGFIDQWGRFYTREEAMNVVKSSGQPWNRERNRVRDELYSEGLY